MLAVTFVPLFAVRLSSHTRINHRCYTLWDESSGDFSIAWNGKIYRNPLSLHETKQNGASMFSCPFGCQPASKPSFSVFCTDSGAVGSLSSFCGRSDTRPQIVWLLNTSIVYSPNDDQSTQTLVCSPQSDVSGLVSVVGDVVYYYSYRTVQTHREQHFQQSPDVSQLYLNSLIVSEYIHGKTADQLVRIGIKDYKVMGGIHHFSWGKQGTFIYPSGPASVTLTVAAVQEGKQAAWAIDAVVHATSGPRDGPTVHYTDGSGPSLDRPTRGVVTTPFYTCRALLAARVVCAPLRSREYFSWDGPRVLLGREFQELGARFELPDSLWLLDSIVGDTPHRVLVGAAHAPVLALTRDALQAVETMPDQSCASGFRLVLVRRSLSELNQLTSEPLNCEWRQQTTRSSIALAVRWAGPWAEDFGLFTPSSLQNNEYSARGTYSDEMHGDKTREHLVHGERWTWVRLQPDAHLLCRVPRVEVGVVPRDDDLAVAAVVDGRADCLRHLLTAERASLRSLYYGCPLLAFARGAVMPRELLEAGADPNLKCGNDTTTLFIAAGAGDASAVAALVGAGTAVCTLPINAYTKSDAYPPSVHAVLSASYMVAPCEPGYLLREGPMCSGLTLCPPGSFCPGYKKGVNRAFPCPAGTYGPRVGMTEVAQCRPCPPERPHSVPGSSSMDECAVATQEATHHDEFATLWNTVGLIGRALVEVSRHSDKQEAPLPASS